MSNLAQKRLILEPSLHQKSIIYVLQDSLRPNDHSGTKKSHNFFLRNFYPFDHCVIFTIKKLLLFLDNPIQNYLSCQNRVLKKELVAVKTFLSTKERKFHVFKFSRFFFLFTQSPVKLKIIKQMALPVCSHQISNMFSNLIDKNDQLKSLLICFQASLIFFD